MKHRAWLLIALSVPLACTSEAQDLHKCVEDGALGYQTAPCTGTQVDAGVPRLPGYADPPERDGAMAPSLEDALPPGQPVGAAVPSAIEPSARDVQQAFPFRTSMPSGATTAVLIRVASVAR